MKEKLILGYKLGGEGKVRSAGAMKGIWLNMAMLNSSFMIFA